MANQFRENVRFASCQRLFLHNQIAVGCRVSLRYQIDADGCRGRADVGGRELVNDGRDVAGGVLRCLRIRDKLRWH